MTKTFAQNVMKTVAKLSTPPFTDRVAISQIYDKYGYEFADAGSLASFKARLLEAGKKRQLTLLRCDLPERMTRDMRERSALMWGADEIHFVGR